MRLPSQTALRKLLDSTVAAGVIVLLTVYVLFVDDVVVLAGAPDPNQSQAVYALLVLKIVVFFAFVGELVAECYATPEYVFSFFFWLDLVTLLSFLPDFCLLFGYNLLSAIGGLVVARAGRAARIASRLARLLSLVRMEKILKLPPNAADSLDEVASSATAGEALARVRTSRFPGSDLNRSTTNKVTAIADPAWNSFATSAVAMLDASLGNSTAPQRDFALDAFVTSYSSPNVNVIAIEEDSRLLRGSLEPLDHTRASFVAYVYSANGRLRVVFDVSAREKTQALYNLLLMVLVITLLFFGNYVICRASNKLIALSSELLYLMKLLTRQASQRTDGGSVLVDGRTERRTLGPVSARLPSTFSRISRSTRSASTSSEGSGSSLSHECGGFCSATASESSLNRGETSPLIGTLPPAPTVDRPRKRPTAPSLATVVTALNEQTETELAQRRSLRRELHAARLAQLGYAVLCARLERVHAAEERSDVLAGSFRQVSEADVASASSTSPASPPLDGASLAGMFVYMVGDADVVAGLSARRGSPQHTRALELVDGFIVMSRWSGVAPLDALELLLVAFTAPPLFSLYTGETRNASMAPRLMLAPISSGRHPQGWARGGRHQAAAFAILERWLSLGLPEFGSRRTPEAELLAAFVNALATHRSWTVDAGHLERAMNRQLDGWIQREVAPPVVLPPTACPRPDGSLYNVSLHSVHPVEMARQITLLESALYRQIVPGELLLAARASCESVAANTHHFETSVRQYQHAVLAEDDAMARAAMIENLIRIATELRRIRNYNGVMEVTAALNSSALKRLKLTWNYVSSEAEADLDQLQVLMAMTNNSAAYRSELAAAARRPDEPVVPFIGLVLSDLTMVSANAKSAERAVREARIVVSALRWQDASYAFIEVPRVQELFAQVLDGAGEVNDDTLWERSIALEPQGGKSRS
ncbi:uncharacterized protein AMSG_06962 [Thecamonas trahens ATCC 50062]|uniref:Ras-GEF domain-containing protein n=1 Tax=Thecamonas trahens ATCC 50062 TaxID=461836 RepID=A0A0L0DFH6_THETB|nr:hypothetical protein AMSG_06962 [Thecamonas trahens ATCC 50062]KNC50990.1 hypothetical protein AMSG_06962 [Thecamonas trahens ATCC 50062]|eukprot:XP_013756460.1 hypothetical protein AMSG_06962 [Thecamonas trahens ATCC 50062]